MSAYMLVYIRESRIDQLLGDRAVCSSGSSRALEEDNGIMEIKRAHLYMNVQIATESNFRSYKGFDLVDWKSTNQEEAVAPKVMRCKKAMTLSELSELVRQNIGTDADLHPRVMVNRQDGTVRPDHTLNYSTMTLEEANAKFSNRAASFRLFIEQTTCGENGKPV
ncbi:hypothetical protein KCU92_g9851, partial [Aureobasidium melanogenum]|jgi:ubiquitin carboxyl-terminal hydrolase 7